jgi:hypothetical protein
MRRPALSVRMGVGLLTMVLGAERVEDVKGSLRDRDPG